MTQQEGTGWAMVLIIAFIILWLMKQYGTGTTTVVQSGIVGGQQNQPTITTSCCG